MEEDCSASGKVAGFNKKIGAEMRTVNAGAKVINAAKKEAGKDKKALHTAAAKIATPQASCDAEMDIIFTALDTLMVEYPDEFDAIDKVGQLIETADAACYELYWYGSAAEIKQDSNDRMKDIDVMRKFA